MNIERFKKFLFESTEIAEAFNPASLEQAAQKYIQAMKVETGMKNYLEKELGAKVQLDHTKTNTDKEASHKFTFTDSRNNNNRFVLTIRVSRKIVPGSNRRYKTDWNDRPFFYVYIQSNADRITQAKTLKVVRIDHVEGESVGSGGNITKPGFFFPGMEVY